MYMFRKVLHHYYIIGNMTFGLCTCIQTRACTYMYNPPPDFAWFCRSPMCSYTRFFSFPSYVLLIQVVASYIDSVCVVCVCLGSLQGGEVSGGSRLSVSL